MLIKVYGNDPVEGQKRYSPAQCLGTERIERIGSPIKRTSLQLRRTAEPHDADEHAPLYRLTNASLRRSTTTCTKWRCSICTTTLGGASDL